MIALVKIQIPRHLFEMVKEKGPVETGPVNQN